MLQIITQIRRQEKHHRRQINNQKLIGLLLLILIFSWLFLGVPLAYAESESVNISAQVLGQHISDGLNKTINDFDFSKINPQNTQVAVAPQVKGVSTNNQSFWTKIVNFFKELF